MDSPRLGLVVEDKLSEHSLTISLLCVCVCRSFGVLLWEVMSRGAFPYAELSNVDVITSVVQENHRLPIPTDECPDTA